MCLSQAKKHVDDDDGRTKPTIDMNEKITLV
jgi:hypothetical protein